jgi:hypothetical protein
MAQVHNTNHVFTYIQLFIVDYICKTVSLCSVIEMHAQQQKCLKQTAVLVRT